NFPIYFSPSPFNQPARRVGNKEENQPNHTNTHASNLETLILILRILTLTLYYYNSFFFVVAAVSNSFILISFPNLTFPRRKSLCFSLLSFASLSLQSSFLRPTRDQT